MAIRSIILVAITALIAVGCKKEEVTEAPVISNLVVEPMVVTEFVDTVTVTFDYADITGDLGFENPNIPSIFIKDSRLENADGYHIHPLTPDLQTLDIRGTISVRLNNLFILGNDSTESLLLSVTMDDRAGNTSNELVSDSVLVVRP